MKFELRNRYGKTFFAHVLHGGQDAPVAFVQHGYSGSVVEDHINIINATYHANGYTVVAFDCTNSFNGADGDIEDATTELHLHDLEDGIAWAKLQPWYREPFALAGHSLGGFAALLYAEENPAEILHLFPAAAVINGSLREEAYTKYAPDMFNALKADGFQVTRTEREGVTYEGRRTWRSFEALFKFDALAKAGELRMPVLLLVGANDTACPPEHQRILFDALPGPKCLRVIADADHCYCEKHTELMAILDAWLKSSSAFAAH